MANVVEAILLGLIQGLTEFLPVSSSGHLALGQAVLGWDDPSRNLAFNVAVHLGSLAAVLLFVRREIAMMLTTKPRLLLVAVAATLPIVVVGLLLKDSVEDLGANLAVVGVCLATTGLVLFLVSRMKGGRGQADGLPLGKAVLVGLAQAVAILPGISRSGSTLSAGLALGLEREQAVRFAFLLAVPAIGGAGFLMAVDGGFGEVEWLPLIAGAAVSFATSLFAMRVMVKVVLNERLPWFAAYCAIVGLLAMALG